MIAAKIDLSHIAPDIICSEVLICKGDSTGKLKCAKKIKFLLCSSVGTVIGQCRLEACAVDGGSGTVLESDQAVLNCLH